MTLASTPADLSQLIHQLPKAELHLHIEGTLEPELLFQLAARNNVTLKFPTIDSVHAAYHFNNLQGFLDLYYEGMRVLIQEQDFYDLTWAYLKHVSEKNVVHVEIFFDPQAHTNRGVAFKTVISGIHRALLDAKQQLGISSRLIMCFLRDLNIDSAMATLEEALPYREWITAVGLDSAELPYPPEKFIAVFDRARKEGFLTVAHAGEEGPADYIWQALDLLKVSRIDHGVKCADDPRLMQHLAAKRIPLTVCPLSNVKLRIFDSLEKHNIKTLLQAGLCVTINSDDPAYLGGDIVQNFIATQQALDLSREEIIQLVKNSFQASFLEANEKDDYIKDIKKAFL